MNDPIGIHIKSNEKQMIEHLTLMGYTVDRPNIDGLLEIAESTQAYKEYWAAVEVLHKQEIAHEEEAVSLKEASEVVIELFYAYRETLEYTAWSNRFEGRLGY